MTSSTSAGHLVSSYVKHHLPLILVSQLNIHEDISKALVNGFLDVDKNMTHSSVDCEFSGTTAAVSFLKVTKEGISDGAGA